MPAPAEFLSREEIAFLRTASFAATHPGAKNTAKAILAAAEIENTMTWEQRAELLASGIEDIEVPNIAASNFPERLAEAIKAHGEIIQERRSTQRRAIRAAAMGIIGAAASAATGTGTATVIPAIFAAVRTITELIVGDSTTGEAAK